MNEDGPEYAYVFPGSVKGVDYLEDGLQLLGFSDLYAAVVSEAQGIVDLFGSAEFTFVGHSLGAGLAAASAMKTGRAAMTYNAAAISRSTMRFLGLEDNEATIVNFHAIGSPSFNIGHYSIGLGGCFVTKIQNFLGMKAAGWQMPVPVKPKWVVDGHSIKYIIKALTPP